MRVVPSAVSFSFVSALVTHDVPKSRHIFLRSRFDANSAIDD